MAKYFIRQIMTHRPLTIEKKKGLQEVIDLMARSKVSSVIITDNDQPIGIITERDLIRKILLPGLTVKKIKIDDVMATNLIFVNPDTELHEASMLMKEKNIRHIPVVENGKLVGIVTQTDIVGETHNIHKKNINFMAYQNIQTIIIVLFFLFLIGFYIYKNFFS